MDNFDYLAAGELGVLPTTPNIQALLAAKRAADSERISRLVALLQPRSTGDRSDSISASAAP